MIVAYQEQLDIMADQQNQRIAIDTEGRVQNHPYFFLAKKICLKKDIFLIYLKRSGYVKIMLYDSATANLAARLFNPDQRRSSEQQTCRCDSY